MDAVLRAFAVYFIIFLLLRIAGKRTLAEITTFDFVLILIIAETTQQALLGEDFSITNSALLITTLLIIDIGLSLIKEKWERLGMWFDGTPVVLIEQGDVKKDRLSGARMNIADILESARKSHGLARLEQIDYAVLEQSGDISIIPKQSN